MSDGTNIMRALAPGEGASTDEDVTIAFLSRDWFVQAYIGTPYNGGALIIGTERKELDREIIAHQFILAACVVMCGGDEPPAMALDKLAVMLGLKFSEASTQMAAYRAARGKPS